eukprot:971495-Pleurochrysis_carterae.AAC.1
MSSGRDLCDVLLRRVASRPHVVAQRHGEEVGLWWRADHPDRDDARAQEADQPITAIRAREIGLLELGGRSCSAVELGARCDVTEPRAAVSSRGCKRAAWADGLCSAAGRQRRGDAACVRWRRADRVR